MGLMQKQFADLITFTRPTGGGRTNAQGQYELLPANTPRIDYDPVTGECRGLLIEEQRTNLLTYSSDFANAAWGKQGATVEPGVIAPNGSISGKLKESETLGVHRLYRTFTATEGTAITISICAKAAGRSQIRINHGQMFNGSTTFDLSSGERISGATSTTSRYVGDDWWLLSVSGVATKASGIWYIQSAVADNESYQGDGTSGIYIWGAQLEAGSFPTSYIPTTNAQVTRAADIASVNELSPWYNPVEGTLFVEAVPKGIRGDTATAGIASLDNGTSERFQIRTYQANGSIAGTIASGGVIQAAIEKSFELRAGERFSAALSAAQNDFALFKDGTLIGTDLSGSMPSPARLAIGGAPASVAFSGHIRVIRFYPRAMPDQLQALTA